MPTYYKRDTSGTTNWNLTTSWSTVSSTSATNTGGAGGIPGFPSSTTADPVIFDASSSSVTINVASSCAGLTISNTYTGTFTRTNSLSVGGGGVTLGSSMILAGSGQLTIVASCTLIANSVLWNAPLATANNITLTFSDSWQVTNLTISTTAQVQLNGVGINLYVSGNYNAGTGGGYLTGGTINVILNGTGGVIGGTIQHNLEVNSAGAITQASFAFGGTGKTYKVTAFGTYSAASCIIVLGGSPTLDLGTTPTGRVLGGISVSSNPTVNIVNDIYISSYSQNTTQATFNTSTGSKIYVSTSLSVITPAYNLVGNVDFIINGDCTWSGTGGVGVNLEINAPSSNVTVTFTGAFFNSKTLKYTSALTFSAGSSNISFGTSTLDLGSSLWGSITAVTSNTVTIIGNANFAGNFTSNLIGNNYAINGGNLNIGGNFTAASTGFLNGTSTLVFNRSTPTAISGAGSTIRVNLLIDKSGGATVTVTGAVTWGFAGNTLNIITGNTLIISAALSVAAGTVLVPAGSVISGSSNLIMTGTSTLDVATGITIPNLATANTITVTLARTTVATNYSGISTGVTFTAASAVDLQVNNIIAHSGTTAMGTNTTMRLMGGTFVKFAFTGSCVLDAGATITGTGATGSGFTIGGIASLNLSAGTLVLPAVSASYTTGTGITQSAGPFTLNMGTNEIDYYSASSGGLGTGRLILASDFRIKKVFYGVSFGTSVTDNGFNIIVKESIHWKNGGFVSTGKIIYKGVPSGTGFVGTGYISGTTLTLLSVTSGTLIPGQYIHCPTVSTAGANLINTITTFGNTYTVVTSQTVGSAGSPVVFYGDGANADIGSPYSSPASTGGTLEIDADSNNVYYFGGQFNTALSELRYLSSNTGAFDGSKAVISTIITGSVGTIDFQGQSSPTKYIGTMNLTQYFAAFILKSDLYVNDHVGNPGLSTYLQNSGGSYSLYVMRNFSVGNGTAVPYIQQPTIRLVGPLSCAFTCTNFMGNLVIAKDAAAVVTVAQSFTYGYATPTTMTYTSGIVNFGATTMTLNGPVSIINPASVGLFSFNNVSATAGIGVTITNPMTITGTLALGGTTTFAGTHGWTCGTLTCPTPGATITLQEAITYTTTNSVTMQGTTGSRILMRSSDLTSPYVLAKWTLTNTPAAQSMVYVSATAIDSSGGMTIYSFQGTTNGIDASTINWGAGSQPATKSFTFVC